MKTEGDAERVNCPHCGQTIRLARQEPPAAPEVTVRHWADGPPAQRAPAVRHTPPPSSQDADDSDGDAPQPQRAGAEVFCRRCGGAIFADAEICPHCGVRQLDAPGDVGPLGLDVPAILSLVFGALGLLRFCYVLAILPTLLSAASFSPWPTPIVPGFVQDSPEVRRARTQMVEAARLLRDTQAWGVSAAATYGTPLSLIALVLAFFAKARLRALCLWLAVVPLLLSLVAVFVANIYIRSLPVAAPF